ncbi:MAG: hypothetical protein U5K99_10215 [Anaerolineales bacterium]|nr:hypothetical protein [Anaerolineales bacterium]
MLSKGKVVLVLLILGLAFSGCSILTGNSEGNVAEQIEAGVAATLTKEAWEEGVESARQTAIASEQAAEEEEVPSPTQTPAAETPEPSLTPTITHVMRPGEPSETINSHVTDVSSLGFAAEGHTYGDQYLINRYERPFSSQEMVYAGYLDITLTNLKNNPPWIYFIIFLQEDLPADGDISYAVEFDLDINGRGDLLVEADLPPDTEWTTAGVRVLKDIDGDVGGESPVFSEAPLESLTGYEVEIFNSGQGDDPDLAWVRRDPAEPDRVQLAVKNSVIGGTGYLWSIWADEGVRDPAARDYNDRWTLSVAGSPIQANQFYPLKEVALLDSTCRSWYGYEPTGEEPGLCQVVEKEGSGEGYKVCYQIIVGSESFEYCDDICQPECGAQEPMYCKPCNDSVRPFSSMQSMSVRKRVAELPDGFPSLDRDC